MGFRILTFLLFATSAFGACRTNQWVINFGYGGTAGQSPTLTTLNNCVAGQPTWTIGGAPPSSSYAATSSVPIGPNINLCNGGIQTPTNSIWIYNSATNLSQWDFFPWGSGNGPYAKMSIGFWFFHTFPDSEQKEHDCFMIKSANNSDLANAKIHSYDDGHGGIGKTLSLEGCQASDSFPTNYPVFIPMLTLFWGAILYDQTGGPVVQIFNSSGVVIMTIQSPTPCTQTTDNAGYLHLGMSAILSTSDYGIFTGDIFVSSGNNPVWPLPPQFDPPPFTNTFANCVLRNFSN